MHVHRALEDACVQEERTTRPPRPRRPRCMTPAHDSSIQGLAALSIVTSQMGDAVPANFRITVDFSRVEKVDLEAEVARTRAT